MRSRAALRLGLLAVAGLAVTGLLPNTALATGDVASTAHGYDISFPQCAQGAPSLNQQFGVVGINGGRPFKYNPCLPAEYGWALSGSARPQVYINLEYGELAQGYQTCDGGDHPCLAYNFGYQAAQEAYVTAYRRTLGGSVVASIWWLDVETMNDWNDSTTLNDQVIKGALDYLKQAGRITGVYSTPSQYRAIAGGYAPGPAVGNWVVGSDNTDSALCAQPLWPGGHVWMFQWINFGQDIDENQAC